MNKMPDEEKDLHIRKKFRKDELVSKKYDDMFEDFLKGDHEMKEEQNFDTKEEKPKKQKKSWVRPFAAVAACTLIITGANVYASTQGYDNIFFLIKDLGNKNKQVTATKDEILSDRDITISFTNIEIADELFIQVNRFVVKDGNASLFITVNQELASVRPTKFIVSSNEKILAEDIASDPRIYSYEIKLNNYKEDMKVLKLRVEGENASEIATLEIDLENKEIDLVASDSAEEVKKISEIDLKQKLGDYAIVLKPYATNKVLNDDDKFYLGIDLVSAADIELAKISTDGFVYYPKENINQALKEAIGEELGTTVQSDMFEYNKELDAYKFIAAGDMITSGLCLNVDDLKYENGSIEELDRFQATLEFTLNENATYTKYKVQSIETAKSEKIEVKDKTENTPLVSDDNKIPEHTHNYRIIKAEEVGDYHTTIDGTHTLRCTICGDEIQEPHHFGKWWTIYNGTAWTLWCEDCSQYIYTSDYDFVQSHLEYGMNPVEEETSSSPSTTYDPSTVDNYASTMDWTEYWAPGLKFKYPTDWYFSSTPRDVDQGEGMTINAEASGLAVGINKETNEILESYTTIEVYDQVIAYGATEEEAAENFANRYNLVDFGSSQTGVNGRVWHCYGIRNSQNDNSRYDIYFTSFSSLYSGNEPTSEWVVDIIRITADDYNGNYKVINIVNKIIGEAKTTSK